MTFSRTLTFLWLMILPVGYWTCRSGSPATDPNYFHEIKTWHQKRIVELMAPDSWLSLTGLFWLEAGDNFFGSSEDNRILFPEKAPAVLGNFLLEGDSVVMKMQPEYTATVNGAAVNTYALDSEGMPPMISYGDLSWILIHRGDKFGIRLWDTKHPLLADTIHIDTYPIDAAWRIRAKWISDTTGQTVRVRNVLDMEMDMETKGRLRFEVDGSTYELIALEGSEKEFFMIFADATSGSETYGGGRYLYVDHPDTTGHTWIDFNKAYNPPCAFTEFATCLLPPPENRLSLAVTAGELSYGEH